MNNDFDTRSVIRQMSRNARRTYNMWVGRYTLYLNYRFIRHNFRSWLVCGYYPDWKKK